MSKKLGAVRENFSSKNKRIILHKALHTPELCKTNKIDEKNRKIAGVTLISLVVTIIVVIILASISVSALYGENRNNNKRSTPKAFDGIKSNTEKNRHGKAK